MTLNREKITELSQFYDKNQGFEVTGENAEDLFTFDDALCT